MGARMRACLHLDKIISCLYLFENIENKLVIVAYHFEKKETLILNKSKWNMSYQLWDH